MDLDKEWGIENVGSQGWIATPLAILPHVHFFNLKEFFVFLYLKNLSKLKYGTIVSHKKMARTLGLSAAALRFTLFSMKKKGLLTKSSDGEYDIEPAMQKIVEAIKKAKGASAYEDDEFDIPPRIPAQVSISSVTNLPKGYQIHISTIEEIYSELKTKRREYFREVFGSDLRNLVWEKNSLNDRQIEDEIVKIWNSERLEGTVDQKKEALAKALVGYLSSNCGLSIDSVDECCRIAYM